MSAWANERIHFRESFLFVLRHYSLFVKKGQSSTPSVSRCGLLTGGRNSYGRAYAGPKV